MGQILHGRGCPGSDTALRWLSGDCAAICRKAQALNAALMVQDEEVLTRQRRTPIEAVARSQALRMHLQNPNIRNKTIQCRANPSRRD